MYELSFSKHNKNVVCYLIEGIIKARSVNLQEVIRKVNCPSSSNSLYRRFQRFFQKEMDFCGIGIFLLQSFLKMCLIALPSPIKIYLSIDRHEWSYGSKVNNLLVAHIFEPITGIDFPVSVIDLNRRGNSGTLDRGDIIANLMPHLQQLIYENKLIVIVLGDREFFSHAWRDQLVSSGLSYRLRLKRDVSLSLDNNVGDIFNNLKPNESEDIIVSGERIIIKRLVDVPGRRDSCMAILTNDLEADRGDVLFDYSVRWSIERAFFNLESNGWNLKKTHLKSPLRIEMMFYILVACYYISVLFGYIQCRLKKVKLKNHGYKSVTLFLSGRRLIDEMFTRSLVVSFDCIADILAKLLSKFLASEETEDPQVGLSSGVV